jgi:hypothetical protein
MNLDENKSGRDDLPGGIRSGESTAHLNDDEVADYLIGTELSRGAMAHLVGCQACEEELSRFGVAVKDFDGASIAWSNARTSNSLLARTGVSGQANKLVHRPFFAAASWALATGLMVVAGVSIMHHQQGQNESPIASVVASVPDDSEAQIEQDNRLLMAVDHATRNYDLSPIQEYGLLHVGGASAPRRGRSRTQ